MVRLRRYWRQTPCRRSTLVATISLALLIAACSSPAATPVGLVTPLPTPGSVPSLTPVQVDPTQLPTPVSLGDDDQRIDAPDAANPLSEVNDFLYQLQDIDLRAIGETAYDLVIMDYSSNRGEDGELSQDQILALKRSPGGPKTILAYMSIGEAEDYRFYWRSEQGDSEPSWLEAENPDWPGNYKVRYWDKVWQSIVFQYTDRILASGFDGVYLDILDAYEYFADQGRATAAQDMADFVAAIASYARARDSDFSIVSQNAPELASLTIGYLDTIDGIAQEDIYFGYEADGEATDPALTLELEHHLDYVRDAGKLVLTVDYTTQAVQVGQAYDRARAKGYVPFSTVRDLDRLVINPGYEPD